MSKLLSRQLFPVFIFMLASGWTALAQETAEPAGLAGAKTVYRLPLHGPIDRSLMIFFRRAFIEIEETKPDAVIVDITTDGGGLLETEEIIAWMRSTEIPIYSYVSPRSDEKRDARSPRALSAGAIICFGTEKIFMSPRSRIGSAAPVMAGGGQVQEIPATMKEKVLSDMRALIRGLAKENGHLADVGLAMIDPAYELKIGDRVISPKGELLNLTAEEAVEVIPPRTKPLLAESIEPDLDAVLAKIGMPDAEVVAFVPEPAEKLARMIVAIGPVLFMLGVLGIFIEMKTPGFGIPGIAGLCLLTIFFFGHHVAGLAGFEDIALVVVGLILLGLEIFVIPGFGIAGMLGILCIAAGTILGMIPHIPEIPTELPTIDAPDIMDYLTGALWRFLIILGGAITGGYFLAKILPRTGPYRQLVLDTSLRNEDGYTSGDVRYKELIGQQGIAQTTLRPSGIVQLGEDRLDVVTRGDMIDKGDNVVIVEVHGARIIVEPAE